MTIVEILAEELGELKREKPVENMKVKKMGPRSWIGTFSIRKKKYEVLIDKEDDYDDPDLGSVDDWLVDFYQLTDEEGNKVPWNKRQSITGAGNVKKVMRTIMEIVKIFLQKQKPSFVSFSASDASRGRKALYSRIVDNVKDHVPYVRYNLKSKDSDTAARKLGVYSIVRKDIARKM